MKGFDVAREELFLRLVLALKPHLAQPGTKLQAWTQVAQQMNDMSKETVFGSREAAKNRLVYLKAVLDDANHVLHGKVSREMKTILAQIRSEAERDVTKTPRRTRSQKATSDDGDAGKSASNKRKRHRLAAVNDDEGEGEDPPFSRELVPYVPPPASPHERLERHLGEQIERDRHSRRERERLQNELDALRVETKSHAAALEREVELLRDAVGLAHPPGVSDRQSGVSLELLEHQRRLLDEMKEQDERREQIATMLALTKEAITDARGRGRDPATV